MGDLMRYATFIFALLATAALAGVSQAQTIRGDPDAAAALFRR